VAHNSARVAAGLEAVEEEILLVAVVGVEGRSSDVGPVEDVLDGDAVVVLEGFGGR
jgi:hypothetical protein